MWHCAAHTGLSNLNKGKEVMAVQCHLGNHSVIGGIEWLLLCVVCLTELIRY